MMFRTEIMPDNHGITIGYTDRILLIGSCFAETIGKKLADARFNIRINPAGIAFNPFSIAACLHFIAEKKKFTENDLFYFNEMWNSFYHHSRFSDPDKTVCLKKINDEIEESAAFLNHATIVIITFGTAWIYELAETGEIVSNCHKLPPDKFSRRLAGIDEIVKEYAGIILKIKEINPSVRFVFTISPVRHLKEGAESNSLSKAILRVAIDTICRTNGAVYFPSFELLTDDLRDYRFYDADLCHPSVQAVDYIWEKFAGCFFDSLTKKILQKINELNAALNHKPFHPSSSLYRNFLSKNLEEIECLQKEYPFLMLDGLRKEFQAKCI